MKILIIGVRWPPETFIRRRIDALLEAGVRVAVAASAVAPGNAASGPVELIRVPAWSGGWLGRLFTLGRLLCAAFLRSPGGTPRILAAAWSHAGDRTGLGQWLTRLLPFAGVRADVAHFEWNFAAVDFLPLFDLLRCPVVVSCRGSQIQVAPHNPARRELVDGIRRTFERAAAVHAVSERIVQEAEALGLDRTKAVVIRPAVDPQFFIPAGQSARRSAQLRIISVGSLNWVKGYEYALVAIRRLKDRGLDLFYDIVGDGVKTERQRVLFTIHDLGLESIVRLRGALGPEEVRDELRRSDVFLLPSLSEGISNAALEAMSCGLPVAASDCGGMGEAVTHGVEGYLAAPRDTEALAACLEALAFDPERRRIMGRAARERVLRDFALPAQTEAFLALYRSLAQPATRALAGAAQLQEEAL
ncbi:MAG: glycosyltransferase family 4 protein [Bryobacterales bacterium]|nr:glycosyltransferase family 4 protein [Bryobacterales bacterium]